jgi:hypothetical protein
VAWRHHVQPLQWIGFVTGSKFVKELGSIAELGRKCRGHLGPNFVTAAPDGRPDGCQQVLRPGAELHLHSPYGLAQDALQRSPPSRVDRSDGALLGIHQENGYAIRRLHR